MKTQTERTHTIRSIAEAEGVDKDVVRKRYDRARLKWDGELGQIIDGVRCFDDEEKAFLDGFAASKQVKLPTIEVGNHATVLPNAEGLSAVNLQRFRASDIESVRLEDPKALLSLMDETLGAIESAMAADSRRRRLELNEDGQVKDLITQRINDFRLKEMQYRIETGITDNQKAQSAVALGKLMAQFQGLQDGE